MKTKVQQQQQALCNVIIRQCQQMNVEPQDTLTVLGGAVIHILVAVSEPLGYGKREMIKVFADGLAGAEIEFNEK